MNNKTLRERCHVNTNEGGDCFVGVKADSDDAVVYFPLGYSLPDNEVELRRDIKHLFEILAAFSQKEDRVLHVRKFDAPQSVDFPIQAYLDVINYYLNKGKYYYEIEPMYKIDTKGRTDWSRTIKNQTPQMQNGSPVYLKRTVRTSQPNESNIITEINKYCVYESFSRIGWLFVSTMPEKPTCLSLIPAIWTNPCLNGIPKRHSITGNCAGRNKNKKYKKKGKRKMKTPPPPPPTLTSTPTMAPTTWK